MKRTFITRLPNKAGAFLKATRIVAQSGANITRVSYNKAVDLHVLFLEVSGSQAQLDTIAVRLNDVGYILNEDNPGKTILLEFHLPNVPSAVLPVLELIDSFNFNITYMSGQENDTDHQDLKVGIYIQDPAQTKAFLDRAAKLCEMRVLNYDKSQKVLDNTVFYLSFAHQLASTLHLPQEDMDALIADSNLLMQHLDEKGEAPHKTFSYIGKSPKCCTALRVKTSARAFRSAVCSAGLQCTSSSRRAGATRIFWRKTASCCSSTAAFRATRTKC